LTKSPLPALRCPIRTLVDAGVVQGLVCRVVRGLKTGGDLVRLAEAAGQAVVTGGSGSRCSHRCTNTLIVPGLSRAQACVAVAEPRLPIPVADLHPWWFRRIISDRMWMDRLCSSGWSHSNSRDTAQIR
jgi:hypothetical protein